MKLRSFLIQGKNPAILLQPLENKSNFYLNTVSQLGFISNWISGISRSSVDNYLKSL